MFSRTPAASAHPARSCLPTYVPAANDDQCSVPTRRPEQHNALDRSARALTLDVCRIIQVDSYCATCKVGDVEFKLQKEDVKFSEFSAGGTKTIWAKACDFTKCPERD